jgi:hypothetical protein
MDETCSMHGKVYGATQNFGSKNMNGRDHLEDLDIDGILKCIKR